MQPDSPFSRLQTRVYFCQKSLYALILLVWYRFHRARALIDIHQLFVHTSDSQNCAWFFLFFTDRTDLVGLCRGILYFQRFCHFFIFCFIVVFSVSGCWFCHFSSLFLHPRHRMMPLGPLRRLQTACESLFRLPGDIFVYAEALAVSDRYFSIPKSFMQYTWEIFRLFMFLQVYYALLEIISRTFSNCPFSMLKLTVPVLSKPVASSVKSPL